MPSPKTKVSSQQNYEQFVTETLQVLDSVQKLPGNGSRIPDESRRRLNELIISLFDEYGVIHSSQLPLRYTLLSRLADCLAAVKEKSASGKLLDTTVQNVIEWATLQTIRTTRPDGTIYFTAQDQNASDSRTDGFNLIKRFLPYDTDEIDRNAAIAAFPQLFDSGTRKSVAPDETPDESFFSQWGACAVFRSGWKTDEPAVAIMYNNVSANDNVKTKTKKSDVTTAGCLLEVSNRSQTVFAGTWETSISINGKVLLPEEQHGWKLVCNQIEQTYDYLELELVLNSDLCLQRHIFLAHDEEIMLLADAVLPNDLDDEKNATPRKKPLQIECVSTFPIYNGVTFETTKDVTELNVCSQKKKQIARLFPIALPEWQSSCGDKNKIAVDGNKLTYRQTQRGQGIFAPMVFDMSTSRMNKPYTWRQLTVGANLQTVPNDQAAGFRLQLGNHQYLIYRSLTKTTNRSVLGHNLIGDFYVGIFSKSGMTEIVEIRPDDDEL
ncbi:MAG: hypothetical protein LBU65_11120 [Planctomycetaceae bacterium]|jgi:hypothetical protein|nr:hypothetical protein [Planctomycetaceae bacterium]